MNDPDEAAAEGRDFLNDPEQDPTSAMEWLAGEAEVYMDPPLNPAWARVLREAVRRWTLTL